MHVISGMIDAVKEPFENGIDIKFLWKMLAFFVALTLIYIAIHYTLLNANLEVTE